MEERFEEVQFIKNKGSREKRPFWRLRWLVPACLLHVLFFGGVFVAFIMPQTMTASAQDVQRMGHTAISGVTDTGEKVLLQCQNEEDKRDGWQQSDISDECQYAGVERPAGLQALTTSMKPAMPGLSQAPTEADPSDADACDPPKDDIFRSYTAGERSAPRIECLASTPVPSKTRPAPPDLAIAKTTEGGDSYLVGQSVTFDLLVTNVSNVPVSNAISVIDSMPAGFTNLVVDGGGSWNITIPAETSPVEIRATYKGAFPVPAGQQLPVIRVRGLLTSAAVPSLTNVAMVNSPGDSNASNNTARKTLSVAPKPGVASQSDVISHIPSMPLTGSDPAPTRTFRSR